MSTIKQMSTDLLASIGDSHIVNLVGDVMDTLISNTSESEVLKSVPILGTCVALYKETKNIQTYLLTKKIYVFLTQLHDLNANEVYDMVYEIDNGTHKVQERLGEVLIGLIDRSDNIITTAYIAQLFRCYILKRISLDYFLEGTRVLNNISIKSLHSFLSISDWSKIDEIDCHDFYRVGLVDKLDIVEVQKYDQCQNKSYRVGALYNRLSSLGKILYECLAGIPVNSEQSISIRINNLG